MVHDFLTRSLTTYANFYQSRKVILVHIVPKLMVLQSNSIGFLNDSVSMFVDKFSHKWDTWIHAAAFVHNTTSISGTDGLTPFRLTYGRDAAMPTDAMLCPPVVVPSDHATYATSSTGAFNRK